MDPLEKFIQAKKEELAIDPPSNTWGNIQDKLDQDKLEANLFQIKETIETSLPNNSVWDNIQQSLDSESLEYFIQNNANEIDKHTPNQQVWNNIINKLDEEPKEIQLFNTFYIKAIAASLALLIIGFISYTSYFQTKNIPDQINTDLSLVFQLSPELEETEQYFVSLIYLRKSQLKGMMADQEDFQQLDQGLTHLDTLYLDLKEEYIESNGNENVLQSLIQNLQLRLNILNQQLEILESVKNSNSTKDEKDHINI